MKIAAVNAIASIILDDELSENYIIPSPFDRRIVENVSSAVRKAAIESGVANEL